MSESQDNTMNIVSIPIELREEERIDRSPIWHVNSMAFGQTDEADLVDTLRNDGDLIASSVALIDGEVVGHAALSIGSIEQTSLLVLAPVAVIPEHQERGIGTAVVSHVLKAAGESAVTVLGDPGFYRRFGFEAAQPLGVVAPFPTAPGTLQLLRAETIPRGTLTYAAAFRDL